jgi:hypothetical protein
MPGLRYLFERKEKDIEDYETIKDKIVTKDGRVIWPNGRTTWQNDKRVDVVSSGTIAIVGLGMLIVPIWVLNTIDLYYSSDPNLSNMRLGIISGFIVVFFVLVGVATTAKVFDALAATAAYSAVLMVFLQFGGI